MKLGFIIAFLFSFQFHQQVLPGLPELRKLYVAAPLNKEDSQRFCDLLQNVDSNYKPVYTCYKAVATMIKAKYVVSPFKKLSLFNEGKGLMENAISKDTLNIEMRYLRLTIQKNVPAMLKYNKDINSDQDFLKTEIGNEKDEELKKIVNDYLTGLK